MKNKFLICILLCGLASFSFGFLTFIYTEFFCEKNKSFVPASIDYSEGKYFKDSQTNLCFYGRYLATSNAVLVLVPCSPEVEKVIKQGKQ